MNKFHVEVALIILCFNVKYSLLGSFWDFVYSDKWWCSSLRITEGELLSKMLELLHIWTKADQVKTFKMARFDRLQHTVKGGLRKRNAHQVNEHVN